VSDTEISDAPELEIPAVETSDDGQQELDSALASRAFEKAPTLRKLLTYLWNKRSEEVSEYAIATEALGRRADFEPREDATVRVQVARLRTRLKEFYEADGIGLPRRIVIPVGSHQIQVIEAPSPTDDLHSKPELPAEVILRETRWRSLLRIEAGVIVLLVLVCGGALIERNIAVNHAIAGRTASLPPFWRSFLGNGKPTRIVVPTPVFFGFGTRVLARDVDVNDYARLKDSPVLRKLSEEGGQPALAQSYVAAADALASLRLSQFLDPRGTRLSISTTAESPLDTLDRENLIVTGTPRTLAPFQTLVDRLGFQVDAEQGTVLVRHPTAGAPTKYETVHQSSVRVTTPGVIACIPGSSQGTHILLLVTSYYTSALVSYLTSESGLRELEAARQAHGNPPYFEAVIVSEINGTTELRSRLVEFHPLDAGKK
jgi:hypothetical protein